jgi:uncharacterized protein (DUF2267 family)
MTTSGISAFETTVQATETWLKDIMELMGWHDRQRAYHALRLVLHAVRDRLSVYQAAALGAQLPMLVRGLYYEGWHPANKPVKERKHDEFLAQIDKDYKDDWCVDPEQVVRAVLQVLASHVSPGEVRRVKAALPAAIRSLWEEEVRTIWF